MVMRTSVRLAGSVAFALSLIGAPAAAGAQSLRTGVTATLDNDYLDFWLLPSDRPDDNYTQGARIAWQLSATPSPARRWLCTTRTACGSSLELGQEMYTPSHDWVVPLPGQRPYVGWLYASGLAIGADTTTERRLGLTLGVTGPPSLAAQAQKEFHKVVRAFRTPLGWDQQLPAELAFAARAGQSWYVLPMRGQRWLSLEPSVDASLGTLRTALLAGTKLRLTLGGDHPWLETPDRKLVGFMVFGALYGDAVAHDLTLDGSTFHESVHVSRTPFVAEWQFGSELRVWRLAVEYRAVTRSHEYSTGPRQHSYGSIALRWETTPMHAP
jgi:lipid A 3-O-deacylase